MNSQQRYLIFSVILSLVILRLEAQKCQYPQKGLFLSFNALSKRDTLGNMFDEINKKIQRFNDSSYTQNSTQFLITDMHPQMYYNQHHQKQAYQDEQRVNVELGDIQFAFRLNYDILKDSQSTKKGWARGRVLMDQGATFTKRLISKDGLLEWEPEDIKDLTASRQLIIDFSDPPFSDPQKSVYTLIVNDNAGAKTLKSSILTSFNKHYKQILKEHLNSQDIASDIQINYQYNTSSNATISIDYTNVYRYYFVSNNIDKGVSVLYTFEIEDHTELCSDSNITFTNETNNHGGLQEVISLAQVQNTFVYALEQGLADLTIDKNWDTNQFQFYMGDLGDAFSAAYEYLPDDPFSAECKWDRNMANIAMRFSSNHSLLFTFGISCTVQHKAKDLFKITMDISSLVRFVPEQDSLILIIQQVNKFGPKFEAIDPKFTVNNVYLAGHQLSAVLKGLIGSKTFGTGWKLYKRRFPSVQITDQFVVFFDPSEI